MTSTARATRTALCLVGLALLARLPNLASRDFWIDEMHTISISTTGEYSFGPAYSTAPIHFLLTRWAIQLLGANELGARIVPLLAGCMTVPVLYFTASSWIGARAALFAAIFLAVSPWHVSWSQSARYFAPQTLVLLLAFHTFITHWRKPSAGQPVATATLLLIALLFHSSAIFYLLTLLLLTILLWNIRWFPYFVPTASGERATPMAIALGGLLLGYLPILLIVATFLTSNVPAWNTPWNILGSLAFYVPPWLLLFAAAGVAFLVRRRDHLAIVLPSLFVVPVVLVGIAGRLTTASASYCLASFLTAAVLAGVAADGLLARAGDRLDRVGMTLVIGGIAAGQALDLFLYHTQYRGYRARWREASQLIRERYQPDDLVVASEPDVVRYYVGGNRQVLWPAQYARFILGSQAADHGTWYALYWNDPLLPVPATLRARVLSAARVVAVLPSNSGPKDRTLILFYAPGAVP